MTVAVIIPFRDRGTDPLRRRNYHRVVAHWMGREFSDFTLAVRHDGRKGDAPFNRSAAYNRGVAAYPDAEVFVFAESDMLISAEQIRAGIALALAAPGLVVPFTLYRYLTPADSTLVCKQKADPAMFDPQYVRENGASIGAVNIVSRKSLDAVGRWDEAFEGNAWDDTAMGHAFQVCCGPTRYVEGPAHHLYHLPGWRGEHLTPADRAATEANKARYRLYRRATTPEQIRELTAGGAA